MLLDQIMRSDASVHVGGTDHGIPKLAHTALATISHWQRI